SGWSRRTSGTYRGRCAPVRRRRSSSGPASSGTRCWSGPTSREGISARSPTAWSRSTARPRGLDDVQLLFAAAAATAAGCRRALREGRGAERGRDHVRVAVDLQLVRVAARRGLEDGLDGIRACSLEDGLAVVVGAAGKSVGPHTHITCLGPPLFL